MMKTCGHQGTLQFFEIVNGPYNVPVPVPVPVPVHCIQVGTDLEGEEDCLFFIWPTTVVHKINEDSPFYGMDAR